MIGTKLVKVTIVKNWLTYNKCIKICFFMGIFGFHPLKQLSIPIYPEPLCIPRSEKTNNEGRKLFNQFIRHNLHTYVCEMALVAAITNRILTCTTLPKPKPKTNNARPWLRRQKLSPLSNYPDCGRYQPSKSPAPSDIYIYIYMHVMAEFTSNQFVKCK